MERLKHRGPDGSDVWLAGNTALGHWHFWTTPEEVGERQPLEVQGLPFKLVFDGRLDNRPELLNELNLHPKQGEQFSDATLVIRAYDRWGKDCFEHFIGEYALAILDEWRGELVCARDALGDRSLFYALKGTRFVVASEPWAVAGADDSAAELNENAVAHFFAMKANEDGETLFKNVYELPPAHGMVLSASGMHSWRYWQPDSSARLPGRSDQEYAEGFLTLLEESVRCRLRSASPAAVLMSGGLDSTSVACLAARMIVPTPLTTLSYVFDELPDCDERRYIETIKTRWGIHSIQVPCDDFWPYKNLVDWHRNPNQPEGNPYRLVIERIYQHAGQAGLHVLLTGMYGDHLYDGDEDWLADLITEGRLRDAAREVNLHLRYAGLRRTWRSSYLRRAALRLIQTGTLGKQLLGPMLSRRRNRQGRTAPAWLTSFSASCLSENKSQLDPAFELRSNLLGILTAKACAQETYNTSRYGLELRHPYRDRRLVEYVLALPAHQLYYHGQYKHVLRTAMQGILPDAIRMRSRPTTLLSLLSRGMEREKEVLQRHVQDPNATWRKYVRADWLADHWNIPVTQENDGWEAVVPWLCVSFASWVSSFICNDVDQ
jgi:asparagine synthase (glutamine-hydrolysing)